MSDKALHLLDASKQVLSQVSVLRETIRQMVLEQVCRAARFCMPK